MEAEEMTSRFYGVACCVTICLTCLAYSPLGQTVERENHARSTVDRQAAEPDSTRQAAEDLGNRDGEISIVTEAQMVAEEEQATSLAAVGWKGCPWCEKFKTETLPDLVAEGYDVRYVDLKDWKGPKVTTGPTLFFFVDRDKIVKVHRGYLTADQVKEYLRKPSLK